MAGQPTRSTTLLALGIGGAFAGVSGSLLLSPEAGVLAMVPAGLALTVWLYAVPLVAFGSVLGFTVMVAQVPVISRL